MKKGRNGMSINEHELNCRIALATKKARLRSTGTIAFGIFWIALGLFGITNLKSQNEFAMSLDAGRAKNPVINKVPPLQVSSGLSTLLMLVAPFLLLPAGVVIAGYGVKRLATGITEKEKDKVREDYKDEQEEHLIEEKIKARQESREGAAQISAPPKLRFDGIYTAECEGYTVNECHDVVGPRYKRHLRFFNNGKVAVSESALSPIRMYIRFRKHSEPADVPGVTLADYNTVANADSAVAALSLSFSTSKGSGQNVEKRDYRGSVGVNKVRLQLQINGCNKGQPDEYSFTEIPNES
jgi:hypothetical protein